MYLIHPIWFYLYGLIAKLSVAFVLFGVAFGILAVIWLIVKDNHHDKRREELAISAWKKVVFFTRSSVICFILFILTPSQTTMLQMAVASYATSDNVQALAKAGKIVKDELKNDFIQIVEAIKAHNQDLETEQKK